MDTCYTLVMVPQHQTLGHIDPEPPEIVDLCENALYQRWRYHARWDRPEDVPLPVQVSWEDMGGYWPWRPCWRVGRIPRVPHLLSNLRSSAMVTLRIGDRSAYYYRDCRADEVEETRREMLAAFVRHATPRTFEEYIEGWGGAENASVRNALRIKFDADPRGTLMERCRLYQYGLGYDDQRVQRVSWEGDLGIEGVDGIEVLWGDRDKTGGISLTPEPTPDACELVIEGRDSRDLGGGVYDERGTVGVLQRWVRYAATTRAAAEFVARELGLTL